MPKLTLSSVGIAIKHIHPQSLSGLTCFEHSALELHVALDITRTDSQKTQPSRNLTVHPACPASSPPTLPKSSSTSSPFYPRTAVSHPPPKSLQTSTLSLRPTRANSRSSSPRLNHSTARVSRGSKRLSRAHSSQRARP